MMHNTLGLTLGLNWNPFASDVPLDSLILTEPVESFIWRLQHHLLRHGGFGLVEGEPGSGKSVVMRLLANRLEQQDGLTVATLTHSTSRIADFYRETGELFGVPLSLNNRWGGFKALRERWFEHVEATRLRPLLLIDEAQELPAPVFSELRLLSGADFDSRAILSIVFAGDNRLKSRLKTPELLPVASRIRHRLVMQPASVEDLAVMLDHLLQRAGNPDLMTPGLKNALCVHAGGNRRSLVVAADMLLAAAAEKGREQLDEALFHQVFNDLPYRSKR